MYKVRNACRQNSADFQVREGAKPRDFLRDKGKRVARSFQRLLHVHIYERSKRSPPDTRFPLTQNACCTYRVHPSASSLDSLSFYIFFVPSTLRKTAQRLLCTRVSVGISHAKYVVVTRKRSCQLAHSPCAQVQARYAENAAETEREPRIYSRLTDTKADVQLFLILFAMALTAFCALANCMSISIYVRSRNT